MPKIKIKKKSFEDYMKEEPTLDVGEGKPELAKIEAQDLTPKKKKKKGKIIIRKSKGKSKPNIIDERSKTGYDVKDAYEMERLKKEKKIGDIIKGL